MTDLLSELRRVVDDLTATLGSPDGIRAALSQLGWERRSLHRRYEVWGPTDNGTVDTVIPLDGTAGDYDHLLRRARRDVLDAYWRAADDRPVSPQAFYVPVWFRVAAETAAAAARLTTRFLHDARGAVTVVGIRGVARIGDPTVRLPNVPSALWHPLPAAYRVLSDVLDGVPPPLDQLRPEEHRRLRAAVDSLSQHLQRETEEGK